MPSRRALLRATAAAATGVGLAGCAVLADGSPAAEWRASVGPSVTPSPPALSTGVVATSGRIDDDGEGRVDAFDADSGERLWRAPVEEPTGLAADGDRVYAGRRRPGRVFAFDAASGEREWTADVDNLASSLATAGETVYVANGTLAAIDAADGTVRWERRSVDDVEFTVTLAPSDLLAATREGPLFADDTGVIALSADDGRARWRWRAEEWAWTSAGPYVHDERVFVGDSERGRVVAIDRRSGEAVWERTLRGAEVVVGLHAQNDVLAVATRSGPTNDSGTGRVHVLDRKSGTTERTVDLDNPPTAAASRTDRFVLAQASGTVLGLDVGWDDPERWRASVSDDDGDVAVATDGRTGYAHTGDGTLWALNEP